MKVYCCLVLALTVGYAVAAPPGDTERLDTQPERLDDVFSNLSLEQQSPYGDMDELLRLARYLRHASAVEAARHQEEAYERGVAAPSSVRLHQALQALNNYPYGFIKRRQKMQADLRKLRFGRR